MKYIKILKWIKCLFLGHNYKQIKVEAGALTNGRMVFEIHNGACERCGKFK